LAQVPWRLEIPISFRYLRTVRADSEYISLRQPDRNRRESTRRPETRGTDPSSLTPIRECPVLVKFGSDAPDLVAGDRGRMEWRWPTPGP